MTAFRSEGANYNTATNQGTLPADVRKGYQGLFSSTGVLPSSASPLVEGAGDFSYTVHTGYWVTSRGGSDGYHYWGNLGDVSLSTADDGTSTLVAPASGLQRIDVIYALHPSAAENGDADSVPVIAVAKGSEASTPVAPSIPVGALELARNTMTSGATSTSSAGNTLTNTAPTAMLGYGSYPYRRVVTSQTLSDSSTATLLWTSNDSGEVSGGLGYSGGAWTVTAGAQGYYTISASLGGAVGNGVTGDLRVFINRNGTRVKAGAADKGSSASRYVTAQAAVGMIWLGAGDTITVSGNQRTGGAWSADPSYSFLEIARVR